MITKILGQLEIDHERGVIYFHHGKEGYTVLRLCGLGKIADPPAKVLSLRNDWAFEMPYQLDYTFPPKPTESSIDELHRQAEAESFQRFQEYVESHDC